MMRPMTPPAASLSNQTTAFGKVRLLLWKNFLLQKRHKIHTIVDIFLPVLFFLFCAHLQSKLGMERVDGHNFSTLPVDSADTKWYETI